MTVAESVCATCDGRVFEIALDEDRQAVERTCVSCRGAAFIADSADYWVEAEIGDAACPCGNETFETAVGFTMGPDDEVRWVTVALRCAKDGFTGVYADWKIDYLPTAHLLSKA